MLKSRKDDKDFPKDRTQFKIALCYKDLSNYRQAIREFLKLIRKFPTSKLVAHSKLNVGYCYVQLYKEDDAKRALKWVIEGHPNTEEAKLAEELLNRIN